MTSEYPLPSRNIEEELRVSMALNRAIELFDTLEQEAKTTKNHYSALRVGYMEKLFQRIHSDLFRDWKGTDDGVKGNLRVKFREAVESVLFAKDKNGKPTGLFDENGFTIRFVPENKEGMSEPDIIKYGQKKFAAKLAEFYNEVKNIDDGNGNKMYGYGNKLTLDFFMSALCKLPVVAEVYPEGLDFRRLDAESLKTLADPKASVAALTEVFEKSTDPSIIHPLMNVYETPKTKADIQNKNDGKDVFYTSLEDHTKYIGGVPFLSYKVEEQEYLVTMNGGLVELTEQLKKKITDHFDKNGIISELLVSKEKDNGRNYLKDYIDVCKNQKLAENLNKLKDQEEIAATHIHEDEIPLVCLDVNIMSGLRPASHDQLLKFLQENRDLVPNPDKETTAKITDLYCKDNHWEKEKAGNLQGLFERVDDTIKNDSDNERMKKMLATAYKRVNRNMRSIEKEVNAKFEMKTSHTDPNKPPQMYMSMGGCGSGKSVIEDMVEKAHGEDFVVSALDSFREYSDMNTLLLATGHHADDYAIVDPYAIAMREEVNKRAQRDKVNIFCDGTGIDYKGRNDKITDDFKGAGFKTNLIAVENYLQDSVSRANGRFINDNRIIPWIRVADKHIHFAPSFLDALHDKNLDKTSIISTDRGIGEQYIIAETLDKASDEVAKLNAKRGNLMSTLKGFLEDATSIVKSFVGLKKVTNIIDIPHFNNDNTTFLTFPKVGSGKKDRVLAVYNTSRLAGLMEKGLLNQYANSPDAGLLDHTANAMQFYAPETNGGNEKGAWELRLKNSEVKNVRAK